MTVTPINNAAQTATKVQKSDTKDQFLKLFLAQLQNQNPLEPMQDREFLMQLAQFTQVENTEKMANSLRQLQLLISATQATALLGKRVVALGEGESAPTEGTVSALRFTADGVQLVVGGKTVSLGSVLQVSA